MAYKLVITEHAQKLIDSLTEYLLFQLQNHQAATHLLNGIDIIYNFLKDNPFVFPISKNEYLADKGYHEALVPQMQYVIVFYIYEETVYIMGVFHQLEKYTDKL